MVVKSKIKYINSLVDKKQRDELKVFIAEGPKIINELLGESSIEAVEIFALKEWIEQNNQFLGATLTEVDDAMLKRLSFLTTPNQVLGLFRIPHHGPVQLKNKISLVADGIQDPGNLGTIVRCADWFGVEQVICSKDSADVFNPKVVQSTMGSIARVKVYYEDIVELVRSNKGISVYVAALDGRNIRGMEMIGDGLIVIGNESKGVSSGILDLATEKITIPRRGKAESLNAGVAAGIILSHLTHPSPSRNHS